MQLIESGRTLFNTACQERPEDVFQAVDHTLKVINFSLIQECFDRGQEVYLHLDTTSLSPTWKKGAIYFKRGEYNHDSGLEAAKAKVTLVALNALAGKLTSSLEEQAAMSAYLRYNMTKEAFDGQVLLDAHSLVYKPEVSPTLAESDKPTDNLDGTKTVSSLKQVRLLNTYTDRARLESLLGRVWKQARPAA